MGMEVRKRIGVVVASAVVIALLIGAGVVFAVGQGMNLRGVDAVVELKTLGLSCGSCALRIEKALKAEPGVSSVQVDVDAGRVSVAYDSSRIKPEAIAERVTATGYGSSILQILTPAQYKAATGRTVATAGAGPTGGCGGGCCGIKKADK